MPWPSSASSDHMSLFYGACQGPERMERTIETHLFVVSPNNSGSTFLSLALAACRQAWSLPDESRLVHGFAGPTTRVDSPLRGAVKVWAAEQHWLDVPADAGAYDWPRIRKAWHFQARAGDPRASVLVAKAPQDLCIVDDIARNFRNPRFLFMVRNPYDAMLRWAWDPGSTPAASAFRFWYDAWLDVLAQAHVRTGVLGQAGWTFANRAVPADDGASVTAGRDG